MESKQECDRLKQEQLDIMTEHASFVAPAIWSCFERIMTDERLTPNNKFGGTVVSMAAVLQMMAKMLEANSPEEKVTLEDMCQHVLRMQDFFDFDAMDGFKEGEEYGN